MLKNVYQARIQSEDEAVVEKLSKKILNLENSYATEMKSIIDVKKAVDSWPDEEDLSFYELSL